MKNHNWKKKAVIAGIAAMLIASGNLPINLVAEDNENPAPDTTETITEENPAPEISDSEDNTNTETAVSTEETDSSPDQSSADKSEAQKTNASADTSSEEDQAAKAPANDSLLIASLSAAAPGIQIQYDESTTIHTVKEGNDTLILYCMNNALHWPHTTPTISSVPTYSKTTLEDFCADNRVTYSSTLESELKALLYAGYPYNGFDQYQIVKQETDELTDDEYNELLTPPQYLRDDFPDSLGTTIFTLDNSAKGSDNYDKLVEFSGEVFMYYLNGRTTPSGLTYSQIQNTAFYKAVYCLINYGDKAKEYYNSIYVRGYYVTDEQAYASTRDAVWNLLYNSGVPNNTSVNTEGLTGRLANAASGYTILDKEPTSDNVSVSGDLSFYYKETDGKWHTTPITLSVPESYNANFTLVLPDGVQEENNQTQFNRTGSFSLVSDDPAAFTQVQLTADMPWMVGDLKVYEPATMPASYEKGFQNMVGAVIRTTKISKAIQITKRTSVTVKKVWDDNSNQDGKRTSSVQAQLYANNTPYGDAVTLNAGNSWTYTWEKLPVSESGQNVTYTVQEVSTPDEYSSVVTGDASSGFTITNMYTPGKTAVQVTKVWDDHENQDGKRPTNVSVQLYADGVKSGDPVTLTASNKWLYTWTGLAMYRDSGQKIAYTVQEVSTLPEGYTSTVTGSAAGGYRITNSYTPKTTSVSGTKTWDDNNNQDGKRPAQITVKLLADGVKVAEKTVTADDGWKYEFTDLPVYNAGSRITYTIAEEAVENYSTVIDGYNITNSYTPEKTSLTVLKSWDDHENQDGKRPTNVSVQLYADGVKSGDPVTLTASNKWLYTWTGLAMYRDSGQKIAYTVQEVSTLPEGYTSTVTGSAAGGYRITNSYTPKTTSVSGTKTWDDNNNQDGKRPAQITVKLLADGIEVDRSIIKPDENGEWKYSFSDLPVYNGGEKIKYAIAEEAVPDYLMTRSESGYDITNSYHPGKVNISVNKIWDDKNNQDGIRPDSIKVQLYADGAAIGDPITLNSNGNWTYTWEKLDQMNKGVPIVYTVGEVSSPEGYTVSVSGNASEGFMIINQHTPAEKTTVTEDHSSSGGDTPTPSAKSADVIDSSPDTADHTDVLMHGITMILSLTAALITVAAYRKYQ